MAIEEQFVQDNSTLNDEVVLHTTLRALLVGSTTNVSEQIFLGQRYLVAEAGNLNDTAIERAGNILREVGNLGDALLPRSRFANLVVDRSTVGDRLVPRGTEARVFEEGTVGDALTSDHRALLFERGTVGDRALAHGQVARVLVETGNLGDASWAHAAALVQESGNVGDAALEHRSPTARLFETGNLGDAILPFARVRSFFAESGNVGDALLAHQRMHVLVEEVGTLIDEVVGAAPGVAWSSSTDNWAMSRFDPYDFESITALDGVLYACGPMGLVRLQGDRDATFPIDAFMRSGLEQLGSDRLKLTRGAYMGYRSSGPLSVKMGVTDGGAEREYSYALPQRPASTWTPTRVPLGRGLRGRYLRYTILNREGAAFSIQEFTLDVDLSERRING